MDSVKELIEHGADRDRYIVMSSTEELQVFSCHVCISCLEIQTLNKTKQSGKVAVVLDMQCLDFIVEILALVVGEVSRRFQSTISYGAKSLLLFLKSSKLPTCIQNS